MSMAGLLCMECTIQWESSCQGIAVRWEWTEDWSVSLKAWPQSTHSSHQRRANGCLWRQVLSSNSNVVKGRLPKLVHYCTVLAV